MISHFDSRLTTEFDFQMIPDRNVSLWSVYIIFFYHDPEI